MNEPEQNPIDTLENWIHSNVPAQYKLTNEPVDAADVIDNAIHIIRTLLAEKEFHEKGYNGRRDREQQADEMRSLWRQCIAQSLANPKVPNPEKLMNTIKLVVEHGMAAMDQHVREKLDPNDLP